MAKKPLPNPEELRQLLRYEPETGRLFWRERTPDMFRDGYRGKEGNCANWNARYAGSEAFTSQRQGYRVGALFYTNVPAHRVVWAMAHDGWPEADIDHIDGDRGNNRLENLRSVTRAENMKNKAMDRRNTSGRKGVFWDKAKRRWMAGIGLGGKFVFLGRFKRFEDAVECRERAEAKHGFSKRHGQAA